MDTWVCIVLKRDSGLIQSGVKPLLDVQKFSCTTSSPRLGRRDLREGARTDHVVLHCTGHPTKVAPRPASKA
ncbi:hypothetical protein GT037_002158 [Alternaria burnsii]|uniref:Uncharacterized protein n=1 Tax=Alternaria burnsii TaxID=1187904 RepID=A0A8H7ELU9_9PLEO|nr:uncharacterized protein GT037_002158 [Alternaria burnsii]KAF7680507.1 hypothetical protein GT037_002158 [Alternaria burnsii]